MNALFMEDIIRIWFGIDALFNLSFRIYNATWLAGPHSATVKTYTELSQIQNNVHYFLADLESTIGLFNIK
jgi:hypothetical protein